MKRPRAFKRDAYFGFRLPDEEKRRLFEVGRKIRRDPSSLMLEFAIDGLAKVEQKLRTQPPTLA
jgi:predicted transcriptional regulator